MLMVLPSQGSLDRSVRKRLEASERCDLAVLATLALRWESRDTFRAAKRMELCSRLGPTGVHGHAKLVIEPVGTGLSAGGPRDAHRRRPYPSRELGTYKATSHSVVSTEYEHTTAVEL